MIELHSHQPKNITLHKAEDICKDNNKQKDPDFCSNNSESTPDIG
jgi:hypothetical protein